VIAKKRKKGKAAGPATSSDGKAHHPSMPAPAPPPPAPVPVAAASSPRPSPMPHVVAGDQGMTVDLSRTVALTADDAFPKSYGTFRFVSGPLSGQEFKVNSEGDFIGRDGGSSQIV